VRAAGNSLYTPPTASERAAPQRLVEQSMANREQIRQQAAGRVRRLFARGRIEAFVQALLDGRDGAPMQEVPVRDCDGDEDAVHQPRVVAASTRTRSLVVW